MTSKAKPPFAPLQKPSLTHTHASGRNRSGTTESQKQCGWRPLELDYKKPEEHKCPSQAHTPWPSAHKVPSTSFLSPACSPDASGPLGPSQREDQNGQWSWTGSQTCPHHGPWRAWRLSYLSVTGVSLQHTLTWAEPTAPCQPCPLGSKTDLLGAHWRSLWRDFGSEKLWMRKDRAVSHLWDPASFRGSQELLPGCGNWLKLWLLQHSGWHQAGTITQACLAARELCTPQTTWKQPRACS